MLMSVFIRSCITLTTTPVNLSGVNRAGAGISFAGLLTAVPGGISSERLSAVEPEAAAPSDINTRATLIKQTNYTAVQMRPCEWTPAPKAVK